MSPVLLRLLMKAKRDAFTAELKTDSEGKLEFGGYITKPFTTPVKALLLFRYLDSPSFIETFALDD